MGGQRLSTDYEHNKVQQVWHSTFSRCLLFLLIILIYVLATFFFQPNPLMEVISQFWTVQT